MELEIIVRLEFDLEQAGPMLYVQRYTRLLNIRASINLEAICHKVFVLVLKDSELCLETKPTLLAAIIVTTICNLCLNSEAS